MLQLLQSLRNGISTLAEVPPATPVARQVLIRSRATLVSAGTERMLIEFGKANWLDKARQQPEKVAMVLDKLRADGISATIESVRAKLDQPLALGYCNAGVVVAARPSAAFQPGDRVVSNGPHAEVVGVPLNLCAPVPSGVPDEAAAFTVVSAIALQGVRLAQPSLGETFVVTGLGLIGLITVQLLRAHGCRVLGIDFDPAKLALAERFGAETINLSAGADPVAAAERFSRGRGIDGVLITAATKSSEPVHQAALMCRKRGRIVLVGVTGLELSRDDFYKKELTFQVSCSYGPGRYDPEYEERGNDYPYPYVRWTAQRNFEAVLDMMADGRLNVQPLITHRFPFERVLDAYKLLDGDEFYLGILLEYSKDKTDEELLQRNVRLRPPAPSPAAGSLGFIGAGGYATKILIPTFQKVGSHLVSIASNRGVSAAHAGRKFGFEHATTDIESILSNPGIDTVAIATRHDSHADLVCRSLEAGKHVFVEKPLALTAEQLNRIEETIRGLSEPRLLMVGFNRRFAPHTIKIRQLLDSCSGPKAFVMTVNAGRIPNDHWTQDLTIGGGRIVGEACHFIDLLRFLAQSPIASASAVRMAADTVTLNLTFTDSSIGSIHYFANGHRSLPKERLEIFASGRVLCLDNFRSLQGFGWPGFGKMRLWSQDKGNRACVASFVDALRTAKPAPIPFDELMEVARWTIRLAADTE